MDACTPAPPPRQEPPRCPPGPATPAPPSTPTWRTTPAALALVERIRDAIVNHDDAPADGLHWGHVGDIAQTREQLQKISDRIFNEGEHAD